MRSIGVIKNFKTKFLHAGTAIVFAASSLSGAAPLFLKQSVSAAATNIYSNSSFTAHRNQPFASGNIDASGNEGLQVSFDYNAEALDNNELLTYGYKIGSTTYSLGTVQGNNESSAVSTTTDETGSVLKDLPASAEVSNLSLYATVTANNNNDIATLTNTVLSGEPVVTDTLGPVAEITSPSSGTYVRESFTITGSASDDQSGIDRVKIHVTRLSDNVAVIDDGAATYDQANELFTYDILGLADGKYGIKAIAFDQANNSYTTGQVSIIVDNTKPVAVIASPLDGSFVHGNVPLTGTVDDANPAGYSWIVKDSSGNTVASDKNITQATVSPLNWDTTQEADGVYTVFLRVIDHADNTARALASVTVDNTTPTVTANNYTGADTTPTLTGAVDDPDAVVTVTVDGVLHTATNNGDGTWELLLAAPLTIGSHTVIVSAADPVGNVSSDATAIITVESVQSTPTGNNTGSNQPSDTDSPVDLANALLNSNNGFAPQVLGTTTPATGQVLSDKTSGDKSNSSEEKKIATVDDKKAANLFGIAWYWWLLTLLAIAAFVYGAFRRANTDDKTPSNTK